jgi:leucine dehydrogenase
MVAVKDAPAEVNAPVGIFGAIGNYDHESVHVHYDRETGLKAIIGIHNTILGPSLGGLRIWNYKNETEAYNDVLRLSRGMTYKSAVAGLNLGGGKAVIIGDAETLRNEKAMRKFGQFVESLKGKYITAEDVGVSTREMEWISKETKFVTGLPENMGGSGDPSPFTAYTVYMGMKAAAKKAFGSDSLTGMRIAVQGTGHVGTYLLEHLSKEGAQLFVCDFYEDRANEAAAKFNARKVNLDQIYDLDVDIYAPCALGATINDDTINRLKCRVVAGAANNQLADETRHGYGLKDRGIIYAPDFVINAGGVINVYQETLGYDRNKTMEKVELIYDVTNRIFGNAEKQGISTHEAARQMAEDRLKAGK